jgi:hypothetical protein
VSGCERLAQTERFVPEANPYGPPFTRIRRSRARRPVCNIDYKPTSADWGSGWIQVYYYGQTHYHPAAIGQVHANAIGTSGS